MQKLKPVLILSFLAIAFYFIATSEITSSIEQKNVESKAKKQWELEMLRDPQTGKIPQGIRSKELNHLKSFSSKKYKRGAEWRLRGPWNVGGRTRGMAIDILDENHMIAGSVSGGLWQTKNGGQSWQKVSPPNGHPGVVSVTQDTRSGYENIWYALSGEFYGTSASGSGAFFYGDGVFRSLDNGNTWASLASTNGGNGDGFSTNFQGGWRIVTSPIDDAVFMATYGSVYKSLDSGNSWTAILGPGNNSYFTDVAVSNNGVVYACLSEEGPAGGFYRSTDGTNFTNIKPAYLKEDNRTVIEIDPNNDNTAYFLSELECKNCGGTTSANYLGDEEYVSLQRYTFLNGDGDPANGNGSWANLSNNLPLNSGNPFDDYNCQGGYDLCIRVQPGNSNHIVIGGTNLYTNTDGFTTPNNSTQIGGYGIATKLPFFEVYPNHHPDQHDVFFSRNNPNVMYSISDGGVRRTNNFLDANVQWQDISWGYVTSQCYTVNIDEQTPYDNRMLVGLQDNGNYVALNNNQEQEWSIPVNGDGSFGYISPTNNFYLTSIQLGRMVKMNLDERGKLIRRRRIDPEEKNKDDYSFINPFAVDPNNENLLYLPIGKKLFRLNNLKDIEINNDYSKLKNTWVESNDSIRTPDLSNTNAKISCLAISKSPVNVIYIGTNNREIWRIDSADSENPKWKKTNTKFLAIGGNVNDIAIDPEDANKVLICYSNYNVLSLFYTEDGGLNWKIIGGNLETANNPTGGNPSVRSVAILKNADGTRTYFAGTSIGLFSTQKIDLKKNTTEWIQESPQLIGSNIVTDIKVRQSDGFIAVGTHGNGVFESYYTSKNPKTNNAEVISSTLHPIPANDKINYSFTTTEDAIIEIMMYNMNGRRMMVKSLGLHTNGTFNYSIDVSSLPSGMYLFSITNKKNGIQEIKKIIVQH